MFKKVGKVVVDVYSIRFCHFYHRVYVQNRCFENELDYKDIDIFIEKEREISEEFLRKALTNRMV